MKLLAVLLSIAVLLPSTLLHAATCEQAARELNSSLPVKIDEKELALVLLQLNKSRNASLPAAFVTKREAQQAGWRPGKDIWQIPALSGKSIGGDRFGNREQRLPRAAGRHWKEADLDYKGGRRGPKRLLYSNDGLRMVTVDHYQTFREVPACR